MSKPLILAADLNSTGIQAWALTHIVPLLMLFVGLFVMSQAKSARVSKVMTTTGVMVLGLVIVVGGALILAFAKTISTTVFG